MHPSVMLQQAALSYVVKDATAARIICCKYREPCASCEGWLDSLLCGQGLLERPKSLASEQQHQPMQRKFGRVCTL